MDCTYYEKGGYSSIAGCMRDQKHLTTMSEGDYSQYQCSQGALPYTTIVVLSFFVLIAALYLSGKFFKLIEPINQWAKTKDNAFILLSRTIFVPFGVFAGLWLALFYLLINTVLSFYC